MNAERKYLNLLGDVLFDGESRGDRTGTGTLSVFGRSLSFDMRREGFPLLTSKKMFWKGIVAELLWFIGGNTNAKPLQERGVNIWNEWADENGDLGPVYGAQWRGANSKDQLAAVIDDIKEDPYSRRHLVSAWNPDELESMALPPCHYAFQFYVEADETLSLMWQQRSADLFLGLPFNIASYALLQRIVCHLVDREPGQLVVNIGDAHIYLNHVNQATKQMTRYNFLHGPPTVRFSERALAATSIDDFALGKMEPEDFILENYEHHPAIKAPISK